MSDEYPNGWTRAIEKALAAPFREEEIEWLPKSVSQNGNALAIPYMDARAVMNRLDLVVGRLNWRWEYEVVTAGRPMLVKGRLAVLGAVSEEAGEANSEEELLKSAVSDALKRCAVHFGIGRYLYFLPSIWAPYDKQKKRFNEPPKVDGRHLTHALRMCGVLDDSDVTALAGSRTPQTRSQSPSGNGNGQRDSIWSAGPRRETNGNHGRQAAEPRVQGAEREPASSLVTGTPTPAPAAPSAAPAAAPADSTGLICFGSGCGKALTRGQHDISIRAFGQPLCPACQKERARAAS